MANAFTNFGFTPYGSAGSGYGYAPPPYYNTYQNTPQQMQQPQAQSQPVMNTNEIFVNGIEDVRNRPLPANSNYIFLDNDKALLYEKIVDGRGQFEVKTYEIREQTAQNSTKGAETTNSSDFVTTGDLDGIRAEIRDLKEKFEKFSIKKQIDEIKKGDK